MNNKDVLKAVGDVNDSFIDEADLDKDKEKTTDNVIVIKKTSLKKWGAGIAAVLAVCIIGSIAISSIGMGSTASSDSAVWTQEKPEESYYDYGTSLTTGSSGSSSKSSMKDTDYYSNSGAFDYMTSEDTAAESEGSTGLLQESVSNLNKDNLKLIYTANIDLQTTDYDEAEAAISGLVTSCSGYFQSVNVNNNGYYSSSTYKYGSYTVRVPAENYEAFVNGLGEACHVTAISQNVQDVGESYYETEGRLATLYTKQERLQELLKDASTMADIIELESALSDTEYQIDCYKSELNHYDSLIGYSTVYISLETVVRTDSGIETDNSFGARLARTFKRGLSNVADTFEDIVLWASYNLVGIIIFIIIVILLVKFKPVSKLIRKIFRK